MGKNKMSPITIAILSIIALAFVFCMVVLVYGGCTGQSFIEVLETWFHVAKETPKEPVVETAETVASAFIA